MDAPFDLSAAELATTPCGSEAVDEEEITSLSSAYPLSSDTLSLSSVISYAWTVRSLPGAPEVARLRRPLSAKLGLWSADEHGDPHSESLSRSSTAESSRSRKSISSS